MQQEKSVSMSSLLEQFVWDLTLALVHAHTHTLRSTSSLQVDGASKLPCFFKTQKEGLFKITGHGDFELHKEGLVNATATPNCT